MSITYRVATQSDVAAMARLRERSSWEGGTDEARMRLYLAGEHHPQHAQLPRVALLAEQDGILIGFIAGHLTTRFGCEGELQWILVDPAHRGSPAATGLLHHLTHWFAENNAHQICVNVEPDNHRARAFYQRHGARERDAYWLVWHEMTTTRKTKLYEEH